MTSPYTNYTYKFKTYNSKWAAVQAAHDDGLEAGVIYDKIGITLGGSPSFFGNFNTTIEPKESWEQLLADRAFLLRDTLPSINLSFSGGHDSYLMLKTFLSNNIKIDKIIIDRYANDVISDLNFEQNHTALNILKSLDLGTTKIIISNWNDIDTWEKIALNEDSYFKSGLQLFPNIGDISYRFATNRNTKGQPIIRGSTHPRIYYKDGKWRSHLWDADNFGGAYTTNSNFIPFFTDSQAPKLHLKQLHVTKNYFEKHNLHNVDEIENPLEYRKAYVSAVRLNASIDIFKSPFIPTKKLKNPLLSSKKIKFFSSLAKDKREGFEKLCDIFTIRLGGLPLLYHKSFIRIYDVALEK